MECKVCFEAYDQSYRRPRNLPCGHTFCTQCIDNVLKEGRVNCPTCRSNHEAIHATQFPINYGMEELIANIKAMNVSSVSMLTGQGSAAGTSGGPGLNVRALVRKQNASIDNLSMTCQETVIQLNVYEKQLEEWLSDHEQLHIKLNKLVEENSTMVHSLQSEISKVQDMREQVKEQKIQQMTFKKHLQSVTTSEGATSICSEAEKSSIETETLISKCQRCLRDLSLPSSSQKVRVVMRKAVEEAEMVEKRQSETEATQMEGFIGSKASFAPSAPTLEETITPEMLRRLSHPIREQLRERRVIAAHRENYFCHLSFSATVPGLHVHNLATWHPPAGVQIVQHDALMRFLDPNCTLTFLDLAWDGLVQGRVYIRLSPATGLGKQFKLLCTGQSCQSYRNSRFLEVEGKGKSWERVFAGDYDKNNGTGGYPLLKGLQDGYQYRKQGCPGVVWARYPVDSTKSAQFAITTGHLTDEVKMSRVFGLVVSGLEAVKRAAFYMQTRTVTISDCGVVLPQETFNEFL